MSTNVIKWSTRSNQQTVALGSYNSVWVSLTLVCTAHETCALRGRMNERLLLSACATFVFFINSVYQHVFRTDCNSKARQHLTYTTVFFHSDCIDLLFHCRVLLVPWVSVLLVSVVSLISWRTYCITLSSGPQLAQAEV